MREPSGARRLQIVAGDDWTPKQSKAAIGLASGLRIAAVARTADVSERTVRRWLANPSYSRYVTSLRDEFLAAAIGHLSRGAARATRKLVNLIGSEDEAIALRASTSVIDAALKVRDQVEIAARLAELEARSTVPARLKGGR